MQVLRLNRFHITSRIYGGFGSLIILGLAIATCGVWQLAEVAQGVGRLVLVGQHTNNDLTSMLSVETMRRTALQYKTLNDQAAIPQFAEAYAKVSGLLKDAQRDTPSAERQRAYTELLQSVDAVNSDFDQLKRNSDAVARSNSRLAKTGNDLVAAIAGLKEAARRSEYQPATDAARESETALLGLRVTSLRFSLFRDAQSAANFRTAYDVFHKQFETARSAMQGAELHTCERSEAISRESSQELTREIASVRSQ